LVISVFVSTVRIWLFTVSKPVLPLDIRLPAVNHRLEGVMKVIEAGWEMQMLRKPAESH
jgi:hypothetical protein